VHLGILLVALKITLRLQPGSFKEVLPEQAKRSSWWMRLNDEAASGPRDPSCHNSSHSEGFPVATFQINFPKHLPVCIIPKHDGSCVCPVPLLGKGLLMPQDDFFNLTYTTLRQVLEKL